MRSETKGLRALFDRVAEAKAVHRRQLGRRMEPALVDSTRAEFLVALEEYVAALTRSGLPIPPSMQRDLTLLRGLCDRARGGYRRGGSAMP